MAWDLPGTITNATNRTAAHFNKFRICFNELALHDHSGLDGRGAVLSGFLGMMHQQAAFHFYPTSANIGNITGGLLGAISLVGTSYNHYTLGRFVWLQSGVYEITVYYSANVNTTCNVVYPSLSYIPSETFLLTTGNYVVTSTITIRQDEIRGLQFGRSYFGPSDYANINAFSFIRTGDAPNPNPITLQWRTKTFVAGEVLTASDLNQIRDNFQILSQHTHTGEIGEGSAVISGDSSESVLPQVQVLARFPKSTTGFTYSTSSNYRLGFVAQSSAQNDEIVFPVGLQAGTYRLEFLYGKGSNCGIATFYLDATSLGTIDTYNAATSYNDASAITSITVATSGWYDFKIKMATKNGSSSGYVCRWQAVNLVRTGA